MGTSTYTRYPCLRAATSTGERPCFQENTTSLTPRELAGGSSGVFQRTNTLLHAVAGIKRSNKSVLAKTIPVAREFSFFTAFHRNESVFHSSRFRFVPLVKARWQRHWRCD